MPRSSDPQPLNRFAGQALWGFVYGMPGVFWFVINLLVNAIAFLWILPRIKPYIEDRGNAGTIHEYIALRYNVGSSPAAVRTLRAVASVVTVVALVFVTAFEIRLGAELAADVLGLELVGVFLTVALAMAVYASVGGFRSVVFTDLLQSLLLILVTVPLMGIVVTNLDWSASAQITWGNVYIGWPSIVGIMVVGSGWFLVSLDHWQRLAATRSERRSRVGFIWYTILIVGFGIAFGVTGVLARQLGAEGSLTWVTGLLAGSEGGGELLASVFVLAMIMAALSTADTFLVAASHSFTSDVIIGSLLKGSVVKLTDEEGSRLLPLGRAVAMAAAFLVVCSWWLLEPLGLWDRPTDYFFIAYGISYALMAPVFFGAIGVRRSAKTVLVAIVAGVVLELVWSVGALALLEGGVSVIAGVSVSELYSLAPAVAFAVGSVVIGLGDVPAEAEAQ